MSQPNKYIFACIDGSSANKTVCDYASWLATQTGQELKLMHAIEHAQDAAQANLSGAIGVGSREDLLEEITKTEQNRSRLLIQQGQLLLNDAKQYLLSSDAQHPATQTPELYQRHGNLNECLIELENEVEVIVLGLRGESHEKDQSGIGRHLETVIRALHRPILVVNQTFKKPEKIMLAYDGSPACLKALELLISSPVFKHTLCHVVHVGNKDKDCVSEAVQGLEQNGLKAIGVQLEGNAAEVLADYQIKNDIDLMTMGAFGHNPFRGLLLGSFTANMLAKTQRPLLLLR